MVWKFSRDSAYSATARVVLLLRYPVGIAPRIVPMVYINGADSLTTLPIDRMTAEMIPGMALGSTTLKMVRSLPAPSASDPSLNASGTDLRLSSVERITVGSSIILIVRLPASIDDEPPNSSTNVAAPNRP